MSSTLTSTSPVYLLGARGLLAGEFLRLLSEHPSLQLAAAYAREPQGTLGESHPQLHGSTAQQVLQRADALVADLIAAEEAPVLVLALPHGTSGSWWQQHGAAITQAQPELTVVDLSEDFRLSGRGDGWHYALPELHAVPNGAKRIAAPGCFATALQLAIVPMLRAGAVGSGTIIAHGVTGSSGSGAQAKAGTHHPHRAMNFHAYGLGGHRHEAEVLDARNRFPASLSLDFTPHSAPLSRGLHVHAVLPLATSELDPQAIVESFCEDYAFLESTPGAPQLRQVAGSNRAQLHAYARGDQLHVLVALDNTLKGGAGQALQALNLALGLPETTCLPSHGLGY